MAKEREKASRAIAPIPLPPPKPKPVAPESTNPDDSPDEEVYSFLIIILEFCTNTLPKIQDVVVVVRPKSLGAKMLHTVQSLTGMKVDDSAEKVNYFGRS